MGVVWPPPWAKMAGGRTTPILLGGGFGHPKPNPNFFLLFFLPLGVGKRPPFGMRVGSADLWGGVAG
jgi:hypothetical protein